MFGRRLFAKSLIALLIPALALSYPLGRTPVGRLGNIPSGLPIIFQDDFSSGDLTHVDPVTGVKWANSANTQVINQNPFPGKSFSLRFAFDPATSTAEQRFDLIRPYTELQIDYDLYFPTGLEGFGSIAYTVQRPPVPSNDKSMRLWRGDRTDGNDGYNTFFTKWGGSFDHSASNPSRYYNEYGKDVGDVGEFGQGALGPDAGGVDPMVTSANLGTWIHFTFYMKAATVANNDGINIMYKNNSAVASATNLPQWPSGGAAQNGVDFGYFLGFADSNFAALTYIYLANVVIRGQ